MVEAPGEADKYIAEQKRTAVISSDSDLLFHRNVAFIFRPIFTNKSNLNLDYMNVVSKKVLMEQFELSNGIYYSFSIAIRL